MQRSPQPNTPYMVSQQTVAWEPPELGALTLQKPLCKLVECNEGQTLVLESTIKMLLVTKMSLQCGTFLVVSLVFAYVCLHVSVSAYVSK